jgi:hypothetical protein
MISEEAYFGRCRNYACANALEAISEAINSDRRADSHVEGHLQVARDSILDALSVTAEREAS